MKIIYVKNGNVIEKEITTLNELEAITEISDEGEVGLCFNNKEYALTEEQAAPIGNSYINVNYSTIDETNYNIDVHNIEQLKNALETVQQANAKDMYVQGVLFNDLSWCKEKDLSSSAKLNKSKC